MTLRAFVFWLKDSLIGKGRIRRAYEEVKHGVLSGEENLSMRDAIFDWAVKQVPFYKNYENVPFERLPIVNKNIIRESIEMFQAESMKNMKLHEERTSGSTGTPFVVRQDSGKRIQASADSLFFGEFAGFHLGTRLYYIRVWNHLNKKSKLRCNIENIVMQPSDSLSDESLELFVRRLEEDTHEKSVLAYASSIVALYQWMIRTNRKTSARVECFITMSESFPEDVRKGMSLLFGCPVISRYSNQECGLISQQCTQSLGYHINTTSFFVEVLSVNDDTPAKDGELGRIVVTDLYNRAMPLIRYDTGDLGILGYDCPCGKHGKILKKVEGRRIDFIYSTDGQLISPVTIINAMWEYPDLRQWQFVQNSKNDYEIRLNCEERVYHREAEMVSDLKQYIGRDAILYVNYVDEIPLLSSGKRKSVVNKCNHG